MQVIADSIVNNTKPERVIIRDIENVLSQNAQISVNDEVQVEYFSEAGDKSCSEKSTRKSTTLLCVASSFVKPLVVSFLLRRQASFVTNANNSSDPSSIAFEQYNPLILACDAASPMNEDDVAQIVGHLLLACSSKTTLPVPADVCTTVCRRGMRKVLHELLPRLQNKDDNMVLTGLLCAAASHGQLDICSDLVKAGAGVEGIGKQIETVGNNNNNNNNNSNNHNNNGWNNYNYHQVQNTTQVKQQTKNVHSRSDRKTPLMLACEGGHDKIAMMLLVGSNAKLDSKDISGNTALHWAVTSSSIACLRVLVGQLDILKQGNSLLNATNINGDDPLQLAIRYSRFECMEFLLDRGAQIHLFPTFRKIAQSKSLNVLKFIAFSRQMPIVNTAELSIFVVARFVEGVKFLLEELPRKTVFKKEELQKLIDEVSLFDSGNNNSEISTMKNLLEERIKNQDENGRLSSSSMMNDFDVKVEATVISDDDDDENNEEQGGENSRRRSRENNNTSTNEGGPEKPENSAG